MVRIISSSWPALEKITHCPGSPPPSTIPDTTPAVSPYPAHYPDDSCSSNCSRNIPRLSLRQYHYSLISPALFLIHIVVTKSNSIVKPSQIKCIFLMQRPDCHKDSRFCVRSDEWSSFNACSCLHLSLSFPRMTDWTYLISSSLHLPVTASWNLPVALIISWIVQSRK